MAVDQLLARMMRGAQGPAIGRGRMARPDLPTDAPLPMMEAAGNAGGSPLAQLGQVASADNTGGPGMEMPPALGQVGSADDKGGPGSPLAQLGGQVGSADDKGGPGSPLAQLSRQVASADNTGGPGMEMPSPLAQLGQVASADNGMSSLVGAGGLKAAPPAGAVGSAGGDATLQELLAAKMLQAQMPTPAAPPPGRSMGGGAGSFLAALRQAAARGPVR